MLTALALAALVAAQYGFASAEPVEYRVTKRFEGFLPVLGGNEGTLVTELGIRVQGGPDEGQHRVATPEVVAFSMNFNGVRLPLDVELAQDFFPKAKVVFEPVGRVVRNEAPDRSLPIRVPGLDPQRLPDTTWLPVVLPTQGVEVGTEWTFQRRLGETDIESRCRVVSLAGGTMVVEVDSSQSYEVWENGALEVVTDRRDAVARARTEFTAKGRLEFDLERSQVRRWTQESNAVTTVTDLVSGAVTTRKLKGNTEVRLAGAPAVTTRTSPPVAGSQGRAAPGTIAGWASHWFQRGTQAWNTAWAMAMAASMHLPGDWRAWLREQLDRTGLGVYFRVLTSQRP